MGKERSKIFYSTPKHSVCIHPDGSGSEYDASCVRALVIFDTAKSEPIYLAADHDTKLVIAVFCLLNE